MWHLSKAVTIDKTNTCKQLAFILFLGVVTIVVMILAFTGAFKDAEIDLRTSEEKEAEIEAEKKLRKIRADEWHKELSTKLDKHKYTLVTEERRHTSFDPYGNESSTWLELDCLPDISFVTDELLDYNDSIFRNGFGYFWRHVILDDPYNPLDFFNGWIDYRKTYKPTNPATGERLKKNDWFYYIVFEAIKYTSSISSEVDSDDVDELTGEQYEELCKIILEGQGLQVQRTGKSGDQGVDLIASTENVRFCIQCKRYSKPVGNSAVQQVIAGKRFHSGTHAAVVTNAGFTASAKELAAASEVLLLSTEQLAGLFDDDEDEVAS